MKHLRWMIVIALMGIVSACSSTTGRTSSTVSDAPLPTITPGVAAQQPTRNTRPQGTTAADQAPAPTPGSGPITPSMAQLQLDGERYAALGDPNAPITMIEFSDFG